MSFAFGKVSALLAAVPDMVPGPYELEGSILSALLFLFTAGIFIGKLRVIRIAASFLASLSGGAAFIVYYINQTSVGNTISSSALIIYAAGFIYGIIFGVVLIRSTIREKKLQAETREKVENGVQTPRRFED